METKKMNFEEATLRLEEIVRLLESGKIALNDSLNLFEEGINLAKFCEVELKNIENKAALILENSQLKEFKEE